MSPGDLKELCAYVESPPVPGESIIWWSCAPCRIAWAAAVSRGVYPEPTAREWNLVDARAAAEHFDEPWLARAAELLAVVT